MCGRYTLVDPARLAAKFPKYSFEEFSHSRLPKARYNVAPTQPVLGVRNDDARVVEMRWGLGPPGSVSGTGQINARSETVATKPTFRDAFLYRRCIVFADGFYEWRDRKPMRFSMKDDAPFAFAGIWEPAGGSASTCAILTCAPNDLVAGTHDRMPVILPEASLDSWLSDELEVAETLSSFLRPYDAALMKAVPASSRLNSARYDAADVLVDDDPVQGDFGF
jgi:putative SOS response-associated peptidase YedK